MAVLQRAATTSLTQTGGIVGFKLSPRRPWRNDGELPGDDEQQQPRLGASMSMPSLRQRSGAFSKTMGMSSPSGAFSKTMPLFEIKSSSSKQAQARSSPSSAGLTIRFDNKAFGPPILAAQDAGSTATRLRPTGPPSPLKRSAVKSGSLDSPLNRKFKQAALAATAFKIKDDGGNFILRVTIVGARGLRNADCTINPKSTDVSDPYCTCELLGKKSTRFKTRTIDDNLNPIWNHEAEIPGYAPGDAILFTIYDEDDEKDELLGKAILSADRFHPHGFQGPLGLTDAGKGVSSFVDVKVTILTQEMIDRAAAEALARSLGPQVQLPSRLEPSGDVLKYYSDLISLRNVLEAGDVVLIKGSWVTRLYKDGGILPRRQDLPSEAIWSIDELMVGTTLRRTYKIVAVSHSWLTPTHPDPEGKQLAELAYFVDAWTGFQSGMMAGHVALFLDWCSLPQEPRSPKEKADFTKNLGLAHLWYTHSAVYKWMFTAVPKGVIPYHQRGWPMFESALASLLTPTEHVLDVDRRHNRGHRGFLGGPTEELLGNGFFDESTFRACVAVRRPPIAPEKFAEDIQLKKFGNRSDQEFVLTMYTQIFQEISSVTTVLDFSGMRWGDNDMDLLTRALPHFEVLRELNLSNNEIEDDGATLLAEAIPELGALKKLFLYDNQIEEGLQGSEGIRSAWRMAGKEERWLWLTVPGHSDFIREKLKKPLE